MFFKRQKRASSHGPVILPHGPNNPEWAVDAHIDASLRKSWIENGYVVIPEVFNAPQVDQYNAIVERVRSEIDDGKDAQGFGDRIGQLHQKELDLMALASAPQILNFLNWAFGDEAVLFGSLQFQRGTQQEAHIDAIFFWPEPCYAMAGAWIALEDIHPNAGPLFYIPGSHRWPFFRSEDVARSRPELALLRDEARAGNLSKEKRSGLIGEVGNAWTEELIKLERKYGTKRVPFHLKKGDVVIWHSLLAHGGSPRIDNSMSRRSAVFHYLGCRAKLFSHEQFMLYNTADLPSLQPQAPSLERYENLKYMRFPHFVSYSNGREIVHPLK